MEFCPARIGDYNAGIVAVGANIKNHSRFGCLCGLVSGCILHVALLSEGQRMINWMEYQLQDINMVYFVNCFLI